MKRPDRRKQRTERLLRDTLIELIGEKGYDSVTVQDIADRANIGRATFYLHYNNKEELLLNSLREMFDDLKDRMKPPSKEDWMAGDVAIRTAPFQHALEYRDLFRATLLSPQGNAAVHNGIRAYLAAGMQERIEIFMPKEQLPFPIEMLSNYMAGALIALVSWWMENDTQYSPEQMADIFYQLAIPTFTALNPAAPNGATP